MKNEKGFSLVELLVVVIIIAIIAAIAIPNLLASRRAGNEASAIQSLRTIHSAQATYQATLGASTDYATLTALSGAGLLDPTFTGASFVKSGYTIASSVGGTPTVYCSQAVPTGATTGTRRFAADERGVIYASVDATTNIPSCATGVMTVNGALPIQ